MIKLTCDTTVLFIYLFIFDFSSKSKTIIKLSVVPLKEITEQKVNTGSVFEMQLPQS